MRFKICSVGWSCADFLQWTLDSVAAQSIDDWDMAIIYDPSEDNGAELIKAWCEEDPEHRLYRINKKRRFAPRNQYEAVHDMLKPADDDVIIFLDLDGDKLAHPDVLKLLANVYQEGRGEVLLTFGQYRPVPPTPVHKVGQAREWPADIINSGNYRQYTLDNGPCFNHLRTVSGRIFREIPQSYFKWENGHWYQGATDYVVMMPALELADGRHKFISDIILDYNHANPLADNTNRYDEGSPGRDATLGVLQRARLAPIPPTPELTFLFGSKSQASKVWSASVPIPAQPKTTPLYGRDAPGSTDIYLSAAQRREILRAYGKYYKLDYFVESGTNDGGTPWELKDDFKELWTIELAPQLWQDALLKFNAYPKVHCKFGDSGKILEEILQEVPGPALFWLDGHYSGGVTAHGDLDTPVVRELEILFADERPHVILVDDARIFEGGEEHTMYPHYGDYPSQTWVEEIAVANGFEFLLEDDIMRLTPSPANRWRS